MNALAAKMVNAGSTTTIFVEGAHFLGAPDDSGRQVTGSAVAVKHIFGLFFYAVVGRRKGH